MCRETAACEAPASGAAAPVSVARPTARRPADLRRTTAQAVSICATVVFGTEFSAPIMRFGDIPAQPGQPPMAEADRKLVMHGARRGGNGRHAALAAVLGRLLRNPGRRVRDPLDVQLCEPELSLEVD
jgi:hypothetical protein